MGCGTVKEKLEYQIMVLKVEKLDILQERLREDNGKASYKKTHS